MAGSNKVAGEGFFPEIQKADDTWATLGCMDAIPTMGSTIETVTIDPTNCEEEELFSKVVYGEKDFIYFMVEDEEVDGAVVPTTATEGDRIMKALYDANSVATGTLGHIMMRLTKDGKQYTEEFKFIPKKYEKDGFKKGEVVKVTVGGKITSKVL